MGRAAGFAFLIAWALPYAQPAAGQSHRMEITLERLQGGEWKTVDPGLVLDSGDRVRFGFRADFDGYLYVMNQGTSGTYELLFPREETGADNRIEHGKPYRIPATRTLFRISGPPGYDIVYWLATPLRLGEDTRPAPPRLGPPPKKPAPAKKLLPRCDDSIFRARGECVDSAAGPRAVGAGDVLPENLAAVPRLRERELLIMRQGKEARISSPAAQEGPVIYEFRLAHR